MNLVKTFALAGGAMVTAIGVLAATAAEADGASDELAAECEDDPGHDDAHGYSHDDALTRLTSLPARAAA